MAVPKRKTSKSKRNQRRSHHALKPMFNIGFDSTTGDAHLSHHIAKSGKNAYYNGRQVIHVAAAADTEDQDSATQQA